MIRILYGPTASGKSALALDWAMRHNGTIVNADSLQVYDALPILTAQPSIEEQAQTPHKLYGFADPQSSMNAAQWAALAAREIAQHGNVILVGGTGMYVTTLLDGIAPIPNIDAAIRTNISARYDDIGAESFQKELHKIDPDAAAKIHPNRREQMIRAMEIHEGTGETMTAWHAKPRTKFLPDDAAIELIVLLPEKSWIVERAARRLDQMIAQGVLDEVREFTAQHGDSAAATKALGFHALKAHLNGGLSFEDAKARVRQDTADYIKRQLTWGRRQLAPRTGAIVQESVKPLT